MTSSSDREHKKRCVTVEAGFLEKINFGGGKSEVPLGQTWGSLAQQNSDVEELTHGKLWKVEGTED